MADVARVHADTLLALVDAACAFTIYDAEVPSSPVTPYVVGYPDPGFRERTSLTTDHGQVTTVTQLTCVGSSRSEALYAADQATAVVGLIPTIPGRSCWAITQLGASPVSRDDTTRTASDRPAFMAVLDLSLTSNPA